MGCPSRESRASLLPIVGAVFQSRVKARTEPVGRSPEYDHHCPECGATEPGGPDYHHVCPGSRPIGYQEERAAICGECPHARDGVCLPLLTLHPDLPCLIEVGVKLPGVACPLWKWQRVIWQCKKCGSIKFDAAGLKKCPVCHPPARAAN